VLAEIDAAIGTDLATPRILATLHDALREPTLSQDGLRAVVAACDALLGLGLATLDAADLGPSRRAIGDLAPADLAAIEQLIAERAKAGKARDWSRADQIRTELDRLGVLVTDTSDGPVWELASG
jgi:cysteinyl-tRNA synthetase